MASVMGDIERRISGGSLRESIGRTGIGVIDSSGFFGSGANLIADGGIKERHGHGSGDDCQQGTFEIHG